MFEIKLMLAFGGGMPGTQSVAIFDLDKLDLCWPTSKYIRGTRKEKSNGVRNIPFVHYLDEM